MPALATPLAVPNRGGTYRELLGERDWQQLPEAVQRRFSRELAAGESAIYLGEVVSTQLTAAGWLWAQLARCVGAPLPLTALTQAACRVVVTSGSMAGAQYWTRTYYPTHRTAQVIRSIKCFAGPTGLEERVGGGIGMALCVSVEAHTLVFRSTSYHWRCGALQLEVPHWLTPGCIEVRHCEEGGHFSFTLTVEHPWFGRILHQLAIFRDSR